MPRPRPTRKKKSGRGAWLLLTTALLAGGFFMLSELSSMGRKTSELQLKRLHEKVATVNTALAEADTEAPMILVVSGPREVTLTLPQMESLTLTERQAMEIGLTAADRIDRGVTVLVKTPAGQVLAKARR